MKKLVLSLFLLTSCPLFGGGIPVYDGISNTTDIIDNIRELIDFATSLQNQAEQIGQLSEQITQMDDQLERFGKAPNTTFGTDHVSTSDLDNILSTVDDYINGNGLSNAEKEAQKVLYGTIDKELHTKEDEVDPEEAYEKHERVEKAYAAYKNASTNISIKRLELLDENHRLAQLASAASTDQEQKKYKNAIAVNNVLIDGLQAEEDKLYRAYQAELERNRNMREKELTRQNERKKKNGLDFKAGVQSFVKPKLKFNEQ
jgi:hypothetical protein